MDSAMFTAVKAENIPSNWTHCCSVSYAMLSSSMHEDSCQFSDLAQLLIHARGSVSMPSLAAIQKSSSQQNFPIQIDHPLSLAKCSRIRTDCNVQPYVLSPILEHEGEEPVVAQVETSETILVRKSSVLDLIKHSSLPAELFSRLTSDGPNQRSVDDSAGTFCTMVVENPPQTAATVPSGSELKSNELLRRSSCPAGLLTQFCGYPIASTVVPETITSQGVINRRSFSKLGNDLVLDSGTENYTSAKRGRKAESQMIKVEAQATDSWHMMYGGQYTLPKTLMTDNMPVDVVLCKSRAKRGCATHPRSIAERIRRTKISERMKKLYDLLPNMDKQVHTADMLDEVVEYVKQLQRQVQELSENINQCCRMCQTKEEQPQS